MKTIETGQRWHELSVEETFQALHSGPSGLETEDAAERLAVFGPNSLKETAKKTWVSIMLAQFSDFMILVLIAAALISGFIGEVKDSIAILVIVILNAVIGFIQEYRAEQAMMALKKLASPVATVKRNNEVGNVGAEDLVPGDIVLLDAGKIIPADIRIVNSAHLRIEEAALTGESVPVEKVTKKLKQDSLSLGDRRNMAFKGTTVVYGRGEGVVTATGMATEIGRIATLLQEEEEGKTPLQKRLAGLGKRLAMAALAICGIVFITGILRGEKVTLMFLTAVSLAVAAIPEALPAVVTVSLALGARKMVKKNALVRKLSAVETLGSVTYICSDKTGTLTLNRMTAEEFYCCGQGPLRKPGNGPLWEFFVECLALNNDAQRDSAGTLMGDPTETALLVAAEQSGITRETAEISSPRVAEVPFDSERKCMSTIHRKPDGKFLVITKGSFESIVQRSVSMITGEGAVALDGDNLSEVSDRMAADGLRVLAFGTRDLSVLPAEITPEEIEQNLSFLGMAGLIDPPREEAKDAIRLCRSAGIKPVMITGDHPLTARNIARRLEILDGKGEVITGAALEKMSMPEFEEEVENIRVYARVMPEQKLKIIKALQDKGEFVAMTGDGVNDAPALKRADIGVAMGITGTDVAKESSHMILLDDNFATIVRAVREGRKIYDNIRKFIRYLLTSNSGEIWTIFLAPFLGLPIPLLPIHILWINLVTDGAPALALAGEPEERGIMARPPRHPRESVFAHGMGIHILWVGLLMGGVSLFTQAWAYNTGHTHWQTMVFTVLCLSQLSHVMAIRSEYHSFFSREIPRNTVLTVSVLATFVLQLSTIYIPALQPIFKTEALSISELIACLLLSSIVFWAVEIEKLCKRKKICKAPELP